MFRQLGFIGLKNIKKKRERIIERSKDAIKHWKIVKGDLVQITEGNNAGQQGIVKRVFRNRNEMIIKGCNMTKRFKAVNKQTNQ
jgi:transcription antitermination factor NusG